MLLLSRKLLLAGAVLVLLLHYTSNVPVVVSSSTILFQVPPLPDVCPSCFSTPTANQTLDFGRTTGSGSPPVALFRPRTPLDISLLLRSIASSPAHDGVTVGQAGARHSTRGQARASPGGVAVDVTSLPRRFEFGEDGQFVDVDAGALWVDVLGETLKRGLTPRSWTDYLYLTVGGTLSVGGISGQVFKVGPQIANVLELDVVTGKGEMLTCSDDLNADLFHGVLGGLGQFGIITRARIPLQPAPARVKWVHMTYDDFDKFSTDQELLIGMPEPSYVEGSIVVGGGGATSNSNVSYTIELAFYYNQGDPLIQEDMNRVMSRLQHSAPGASSSSSNSKTSDVSYFDFLNRVRAEELDLRSKGLWEVPHPWLNLFVPRSHIASFVNDLLLPTISAGPPVNGPILVYPFPTHKWNHDKLSMVIPHDDSGVVYTVGVLRSAPASCSPDSQCIKDLFHANQVIIDAAVTGAGGAARGRNMGAKEYLAYWENESEWAAHFGQKWGRVRDLKEKYDPLHILAPGQNIFKRRNL